MSTMTAMVDKRLQRPLLLAPVLWSTLPWTVLANLKVLNKRNEEELRPFVFVCYVFHQIFDSAIEVDAESINCICTRPIASLIQNF